MWLVFKETKNVVCTRNNKEGAVLIRTTEKITLCKLQCSSIGKRISGEKQKTSKLTRSCRANVEPTIVDQLLRL